MRFFLNGDLYFDKFFSWSNNIGEIDLCVVTLGSVTVEKCVKNWPGFAPLEFTIENLAVQESYPILNIVIWHI